jgi:hypothetical protein
MSMRTRVTLNDVTLTGDVEITIGDLIDAAGGMRGLFDEAEMDIDEILELCDPKELSHHIVRHADAQALMDKIASAYGCKWVIDQMTDRLVKERDNLIGDVLEARAFLAEARETAQQAVAELARERLNRPMAETEGGSHD